MQEDLFPKNHKIITKLKAILKLYENMEVDQPKGCMDFGIISQYDYLEKTKKYVAERVPSIIEWLETGKLPDFIFEPSIKVGRMLNDSEIIKAEDEIIIAQREEKYGTKAF